MTDILANVSRMFADIEPCYVSGSQAELGPCAGEITWRNALAIAAKRDEWLETDESTACDGMREWAERTGAWDDEEIQAWSVEECIALFVQDVANDLRMLGSDAGEDFHACVAVYADTDWDKRSEYPRGSYFAKANAVHVEYYTGI